MAKFRNVSVKFWSDPFIETLTPEQKYFFLYLITNEHTSQCGIYEISLRQMSFETGYNLDTVNKLMLFFIDKGKIKYSESTKELAIKNFVKHNPQGSPKVKKFVEKELETVKDRVLIGYIYGMDTLSQEEEDEEEEEEEKQEEGFCSGDKIVLNVEKCTEIALKDERWVNANKTNEAELKAFNAHLEKQGTYLKNPAEYKKHFSNWKNKKAAEKPNTVPVENKPKTLKERYLSPLLREGITLNEWEAEFDRLRPNLEAVDLTYINQSYIRGEPKWKKAVLQEFFKR